MAPLFHFVLLFTLACLAGVALSANTNRVDNRGRYNPQYNDPYYNSRYYKNRDHYTNRDYYNNRQYYDNYFKRYNPDVLAPQARILEQDMKSNHDGTYSYSYETENGINVEEHGAAVKVGTEEQKEVVEGSYSFVTPEGVRVIVHYTADENGFHPSITYDGLGARQLAVAQDPADVSIQRNSS